MLCFYLFCKQDVLRIEVIDISIF